MPSLSLSRKVEKVITLRLRNLIDDASLNIYEGHEKNDVVQIPHLVCYAEDSSPHPEMPTSTGVRIVTMRLQLRVDSEDESDGADPRCDIDDWRKQIEDALFDVDGLMAFINSPDYGWDDRGINNIHVYDTEQQNETSEFEHTDWIEQIVFRVACQPCDG